ncbi:MAG: cobalamin B12-binding domain-containing protein [Deltaproteobacteria bacterium]|nr:cobalamin B12-binding domain-containing protein [Deltaproteobacteria bacterium]
MKILLVQPTSLEEGRFGLENSLWLSEPVALTSVAAAAAGHEVEILDMRLEEPRALVETLRRFRPDLVGTTSMTTDCYQAKAVLRTVKAIDPSALTLIGGHHPTLSSEGFAEPYVDVMVRGEGELTFAELLAAYGKSKNRLDLVGIPGTVVRTEGTSFVAGPKRSQVQSLDALPPPRRDLIKRYQGRYFYITAQPMASIFTSRGCSFDCNFCAIWEFYERRTRFLSAEKIVEQMESLEEPFVFLLDDNFLTRTDRLVRLCELLEAKPWKKYWMTQGRTDFIAEHPDLIKRLAGVGLSGILCGFESNADDALAELRKKNNADKNRRAAEILRDNGILATGIFMVRPGFDTSDFRGIRDYIADLAIPIPLLTILTPLPGTEMWRRLGDKLLTRDYRYFDLMHATSETKLPREEFYRQFIWALDSAEPGVSKVLNPRRMLDKPEFWWKNLLNLPRFMYRKWRYQRVHLDYRSFMRSELGVISPASEPLRESAQYAPKGTITLSASASDVMVPAPRIRRAKLPASPEPTTTPEPEANAPALAQDHDAPEAE